MMSEPILINSTSGLPPAGHYSHAVCAGGMIYLSGQLPVTPLGVALSNQPFDIQVKQVFTNIEGILADCHCTVNSLVQVRVYLCDIALWSHKPARCIVPVPVLHHDLALEIEVVALLPA